MRRQGIWYILVIGYLVAALVACTRGSQFSEEDPRPTSTPQATARPLAVALTDTPLLTPATQASSPQPSSTFRPTLGPSPTALVTPRPTPDTQRSTSRPTPSPIIVIPKLTRSPTASPIAVTLTSTPFAPRSTPSASLIPASAPRLYETTVTLTTYGYQQALEPSGKDDPIYPYPHLNPSKVGPPLPRTIARLC